jgi:hypothetical protein
MLNLHSVGLKNRYGTTLHTPHRVHSSYDLQVKVRNLLFRKLQPNESYSTREDTVYV